MNGLEIFFLILLIVVLAITGRAIYRRLVGKLVIFEYQQGLLFKHGKFVRLLAPGMYRLYRPVHSVQMVDIRVATVSLTGQEVLTADNVGIKVSLAASFKVADACVAINKVMNYRESLYLFLQLNLRDIVGALEVDDLLSKRAEIGKQLLEQTQAQAAEIGLALQVVNIKDIMFPGELKEHFCPGRECP